MRRNYLDVETIDADAQVRFVFHVFFTGVEFFTFVDVLAARLAPVMKINKKDITFRTESTYR